jgi:hypothetical protein
MPESLQRGDETSAAVISTVRFEPFEANADRQEPLPPFSGMNSTPAASIVAMIAGDK